MATDTPPVEPLLVTVKYAAQRLGLSNKAVYDLCKRGELASGKTSTGRRLIRTESLHEYADTLTSQRESA